MTKQSRGLLAIFTLAILLAADQRLSAGELSGTGEWQSLSADAIKGTWSVQVTQKGTDIAGTLTLTGSNVFKSGAVAGTMDATNITFGVLTEAGKQASFSGKLDGGTINGEWESSAVGDHGVWYGTMTKK